MLNSTELLNHYYLDVRCQLIEIAAMIDRFEAAAVREGKTLEEAVQAEPRMKLLLDVIDFLSDRKRKDRAEAVLNLFSDPIPAEKKGPDRHHPF